MYRKRILYPEGKNKALTLSYDDGTEYDVRLIELMKKYGIRGTFNLNGCHYTSDRVERENNRILSVSEMQEVYDPAFTEIATHGYTHPRLDQLPSSGCMLEILRDRMALEKATGRIIRGHAYPYGTYNDSVVRVCRDAGIVYARTTVSHHNFSLPDEWLTWGATCHHMDRALNELTDRFLNETPVKRGEDGWLFYLWGHSYEFNALQNWDLIEGFFSKVSDNGDIWYATNGQIYDYVNAYRSLVFNAECTKVFNPTRTDVWAGVNGATVKIAAGETVQL